MSVLQRVRMPCRDGATGWIKSGPLGPAELRGHVVLVNFWTLTCINWLHREPYVRACVAGLSRRRVARHGIPHARVLIRARHRRQAVEVRDVDSPVAQDNDYAGGSPFANHYWPAVYFVDADGVIGDKRFGEGRLVT
jgi:hypothetical protein